MTVNLKGRNFITTQDWSREELEYLIELAFALKRDPFNSSLANKTLFMIFFSPSLRTRSSFDVAMSQLGGHSVVLQVGGGMVWDLEVEEGVVMEGKAAEHIKDAARVISRYGDAVAIRKFPDMIDWSEEKKDKIINGFARWGDIPVINMESHLYHPCQAMADMMTIKEHLGDQEGKNFVLTWAYHPKPLPMSVGDSAVLTASKFGMNLTIAHPKGYDLDEDIMRVVRENTEENGSSLTITDDMDEAFHGADIIYAKSWGALSFYNRWEEEKAIREKLRDWRVTQRRMNLTNHGEFMHCLPVRRNIVVDDEVLDGPDCIAYDEAENRLHIQKAILRAILGTEIGK